MSTYFVFFAVIVGRTFLCLKQIKLFFRIVSALELYKYFFSIFSSTQPIFPENSISLPEFHEQEEEEQVINKERCNNTANVQRSTLSKDCVGSSLFTA